MRRGKVDLRSMSGLRHARINQQLRHRRCRLRRAVFGLLACAVDAFDQEQRARRRAQRSSAHAACELVQALAEDVLVSFGDQPGRIVARFHGGAAETAAYGRRTSRRAAARISEGVAPKCLRKVRLK